MAWWKTGEGDDVCGDAVVDVLTKSYGSMRARAGGAAPPGMADMLRTWQDALNAEARSLVADADASAYAIRMEVEPMGSTDEAGTTVSIAATTTPSPVPARAEALEALRSVMRTFRDATDRPPRTRELAYALRFALGVRAADGHFAEGPCRIVRITIEPLTTGAAA